jgi:hypothetical protein
LASRRLARPTTPVRSPAGAPPAAGVGSSPLVGLALVERCGGFRREPHTADYRRSQVASRSCPRPRRTQWLQTSKAPLRKSELAVLGTPMRRTTAPMSALGVDFIDVLTPPGDAVVVDAHDDDATPTVRRAVGLGSRPVALPYAAPTMPTGPQARGAGCSIGARRAVRMSVTGALVGLRGTRPPIRHGSGRVR